MSTGLHMHPFLLDTSRSGGSRRSSDGRVSKVMNNVKYSRRIESASKIDPGADQMR